MAKRKAEKLSMMNHDNLLSDNSPQHFMAPKIPPKEQELKWEAKKKGQKGRNPPNRKANKRCPLSETKGDNFCSGKERKEEVYHVRVVDRSGSKGRKGWKGWKGCSR